MLNEIVPPIGAKDFRDFAYRTEPEWSLWGVDAPIAVVAAALVELSGGRICPILFLHCQRHYTTLTFYR